MRGLQPPRLRGLEREISALAALRRHFAMGDAEYARLLARVIGKTPADALTASEAGVVINELLARARGDMVRREDAAA